MRSDCSFLALNYFTDSIIGAVGLLFALDPQVYLIMWTSVHISLIAALLASSLGIPLGAVIALGRFPGKSALMLMLGSLMALPTVTIGLFFYGLLSRQGPLGELGLLYSKTAIIIGQTVLILPIIVHMTVSAIQAADSRLLPTLRMLGANRSQMLMLVVSELRMTILSGVIAGFGRAIGEVGVAMMLGGNIKGFTRTMTTAIALETSKGEFDFALALGILLLMIAVAVNAVLRLINRSRT